MTQTERDGRFDRLRGVAIFGMIAVHVANALPFAPPESPALGTTLSIAAGFVAPAFFLLAGFLLAGSLRRRPVGQRRDLWFRALSLILLTSWLHFPVGSLQHLLGSNRFDVLAATFDLNALGTIAIGMMVVLGVDRLGPSSSRLSIVRNAGVLFALLLLAAMIDLLAARSTSTLVTAVLGPRATFPLQESLPYVLFGTLIGQLYGAESEAPFRKDFAGLSLFGGSLLLIVSSLANVVELGSIWTTGPVAFSFRAGGVLVAVGLIESGISKWLRSLPMLGRCDRLLRACGRASLPIYVLHLIVLFGSPINEGLPAVLRRTGTELADPMFGILVGWGVSVAIAAGVAWQQTKGGAGMHRRILVGLLAAWLAVFLAA